MLVVFSLFMSFSVNPELSLVFLCSIPVLGGGLFYIMTHAHPIFERVFKKYDKLNNVVQENLHGIRVVKSFVREDHEIDKFKGVSKEIYDDFSKAERLLAFNQPLMQFNGCMLFGFMAWEQTYSQRFNDNRRLIGLISYAMQILMSLMMLSMVLVMIVISQASCERIVENS